MRETLVALQAERERAGSPDIDLRELTHDLLNGEVTPPTADIRFLMRRGVEADAFYEDEVAPSWEGLGEAQRAARLEAFMEMLEMLDQAGDAAGLPPDMSATVHTKTLLLAWAFDETYGYLSRLVRGT